MIYYSNTRNRSSTDESLDEDEENLLEVEDVTAYLKFNKEVRLLVSFYQPSSFLIPMTVAHTCAYKCLLTSIVDYFE